MSLKSLLPRKIWSSTSPSSPKYVINQASTFLSCLPFPLPPLPQPQNAERHAVRSGLCKGSLSELGHAAPWPAAGLSKESSSSIHLNVLPLRHALRFGTPLFLKPELLESRKHAKSWEILCVPKIKERGRKGKEFLYLLGSC